MFSASAPSLLTMQQLQSMRTSQDTLCGPSAYSLDNSLGKQVDSRRTNSQAPSILQNRVHGMEWIKRIKAQG